MKAIEKHDELCHDVSQHLDVLDRQQEKAKKFFEGVDSIREWAPKVEESIKQTEPKSKDPEDLKEELKRLDVGFIICFSFVYTMFSFMNIWFAYTRLFL